MARNIKRDVADETLLLAEVREVQRLVAALPDRDTRPAEEILGYDASGFSRWTMLFDTSALLFDEPEAQ